MGVVVGLCHLGRRQHDEGTLRDFSPIRALKSGALIVFVTMSYFSREARRFVARCVNTWSGLVYAWREEASFHQWVIVNIISIALTFVFDVSSIERLILIILGLLILVVELLNTGIEAAIDRISKEQHDLSKKAKDVACAAVALMASIGGFAWIYILLT